MAHYKAMLRVMEYVYSTKEMGLMIRPNREMRWPGDEVVILGTGLDNAITVDVSSPNSPVGQYPNS